MRKQTIQWHPGFYAGMELELRGYHLDFEAEHELTRGPLYIDILIIRKLMDERIDNEIGEIFRKHNIVEYKSPDDELSIRAIAAFERQFEKAIEEVLSENR